MKKIVLILISIFLLSGCTVFYEIKIDEGLTITEDISFKEDNVMFDEYSPLTKREYMSLLEQIKKSANENNYIFTDKSNGSNIDLNLNRKVLFKEFKDPILLKGKYKNLRTTCNEKFCSLSASVVENTILGDGNFLYYNIAISLPFEVIKNNAQYVDENTNTYHWYYSPLDEQKNIEIVFKNGGKNIVESKIAKEKTKLIIWVIISIVITTIIGAIGYKVYTSNKVTL